MRTNFGILGSLEVVGGCRADFRKIGPNGLWTRLYRNLSLNVIAPNFGHAVPYSPARVLWAEIFEVPEGPTVAEKRLAGPSAFSDGTIRRKGMIRTEIGTRTPPLPATAFDGGRPTLKAMKKSWESYERGGRLRVVRGRGRIVIRTRYSITAIYSILGSFLLLLFSWLLWGDRTVSSRHPLFPGGSYAIAALFFAPFLFLYGIALFFRKDELTVSGNVWTYKARSAWRWTGTSVFPRGAVVGLRVDQDQGSGAGYFGLRIILRDGSALLYSHADADEVRKAAARVSAELGIPLEST
jgi:hypothetical protein